MPEHRLRPPVRLTLSPEERARLDAFAERWGLTRSAAVARLVREAELPRPLRPANEPR